MGLAVKEVQVFCSYVDLDLFSDPGSTGRAKPTGAAAKVFLAELFKRIWVAALDGVSGKVEVHKGFGTKRFANLDRRTQPLVCRVVSNGCRVLEVFRADTAAWLLPGPRAMTWPPRSWSCLYILANWAGDSRLSKLVTILSCSLSLRVDPTIWTTLPWRRSMQGLNFIYLPFLKS